MEPADDATLEPAIQWLLQTILASPLLDRRDPWVCKAGLAEEMRGLRSETSSVHHLVCDLKGRAFGNEALSRSFVELKEQLYDADDLVDELDYWKIQEADCTLQADRFREIPAGHEAPQFHPNIPVLTGPRRLQQLDQGGTSHGTDGHVTGERSRENADEQGTSAGRLQINELKEFEIIEVTPNGAPLKAKCKHCGTMIKWDTSHRKRVARRHLESKSCTQKRDQGGTLHGTDGHVTIERSRENAEVQGMRSASRLRIDQWEQFEVIEVQPNGAPLKANCKHCQRKLLCNTKQGTGVLRRHLESKRCTQERAPLSTADASTNPTTVAAGSSSSRKRRRDEESTQVITEDRNPWNKADLSNRIKYVTRELQSIRECVVQGMLGPDFAASSNHHQSSHQCRTTSSLVQGRVYGRIAEKSSIMEHIKDCKSDHRLTVLTLVGTGGIGKTALTQLVYNDSAVIRQFDVRIWVWVSIFDETSLTRLTREMLGYISTETYAGNCNLAKLHEVLKGHVKSKRVLLVLDDVWEDMDDSRWKTLIAPFESNGADGNMIIVTTRKPCVAEHRKTHGPIKLRALRKDDFWPLFKAHAKYDEDNDVEPSLCDLGQQIAETLKGNPLAAQTAGALLRVHTADHWSSILKNEDWKSLQLSSGIMPALKLCYDQLPYHLQQCFSYCSLFPYGYPFLVEELVHIWISQRFVKGSDPSKRLEEIGRQYLTHLVNLGFFEEVENKSSSGSTQTCYVMYNLMHDLARVVSRTEYATIDGLQCNGISATVRHLSIISNSIYQMEDQIGNVTRSEEFEDKLRNIVKSVGKLRSLVLIGQYGSFFFHSFQTQFQEAHNLRLLHLSATSADFHSFLCNLVNPTHLRYLKLENGHAEQGDLPQVLSKSFHLQVLDVNQYSAAWLASLQTVHLDNSGEPQIILSLERLPFLTRLKLSNMHNVKEVSVPSLEELVLIEMPKLKTCSCTSVGGLKSSLRLLEIQCCPALEVFDLFSRNYETEHDSWLKPRLRKLIIFKCPNLHIVIPLRPSDTSSELLISGVSKIKESSSLALEIKRRSPYDMTTLEDQFLTCHDMGGRNCLEINDCWNLVPISLRTFGHLIFLKELRIENCKKIPSNNNDLPSLETLCIWSSEITGKWLSLMLQHSPTLKKLILFKCLQLTQLQIEEEENIQSNLISASEASSSRYQLQTSIWFNPTSSLQEIYISRCLLLILDGSREGLLELPPLKS